MKTIIQAIGISLLLFSISVLATGPLTTTPTLRTVTIGGGGAETFGPGLTTDQINANFNNIAAVANDANVKVISVTDYGAIPNSISDQYGAFAAAVSAVTTSGTPLYGASIQVPSGNYVLSAAPNWSSNSIQWVFANHVTFSGVGASSFPRANTNPTTMPVSGIFSQFYDSVTSPSGGGPSALTSEIFQPTTATGNYIAGYFGAQGSSTVNTAYVGGVWGLNVVANSLAGMTGTITGVEIDVNTTSAVLTNSSGLSIQGLGTYNASDAIKIARSDSSLWTYGLDMYNVVNGILINPTTLGLTIGSPAGGQGSLAPQAITVEQISNNAMSDILFANRATDVAPVGSFLRLANAANNLNLFKVDISGNLYAGRLASIGGPTPALTSCGTSPSVTTGSVANMGQITFGTGTPTSCTLTFPVAFDSSAFCTATPASAYTGTYYFSTSSATGFTLTLGTGTNSVVFNYICFGN
jgi:hypothetical protein